jgi:hypothetical protein
MLISRSSDVERSQIDEQRTRNRHESVAAALALKSAQAECMSFSFKNKTSRNPGGEAETLYAQK